MSNTRSLKQTGHSFTPQRLQINAPHSRQPIRTKIAGLSGESRHSGQAAAGPVRTRRSTIRTLECGLDRKKCSILTKSIGIWQPYQETLNDQSTYNRAKPARSGRLEAMSMLDQDNPVSFRRPHPVVFASEPLRSTADFGLFAASLPLLLRLPKGDGRPVLVLPGFMASDTSTEPLRWLLRHLEYRTYDWDQGRNIGPTATIVDGLVDRFDQVVVAETGEPITLIGWSLGGLYSRALAERAPNHVRHSSNPGKT